MRTIDLCARSCGAIAALALAAAGTMSGQSPDLDQLLARVSERIERYYGRVQSIVCIEKVTTQPVGNDMTPFGFSRVLEYELRVEPDTTDEGRATDAKVIRDLKKVNGRVPRPNDKEKCLDPNPLSPEPLAFLLPGNRRDYAFTWAGFGKGKDQRAWLIDFRSLERGKPEIKPDERGVEGCFQVNLPGATKGRIWIDADTHDVLRVEEHLTSRVDIRVPYAMQRKHNLPDSVVLDRADSAIRYKVMTFNDPRETVLVPESIDNFVVYRGGLASYRKQQVFTDYRRFLTAGRLVK